MCKTMKQIVFLSVMLSLGLLSCTSNEVVENSSVATEQLLWAQQDTLAIARALRSTQDSLNNVSLEASKLFGQLGSLPAYSRVKVASAEQIYNVVVMGDCELDYRGITYNELYAKLGKIAGIGTTYNGLRYNDGTVVSKPELALIAGDLTGSHAEASSWTNLRKILKQFNDKGIYTFANIGNHDWEPRNYNDGTYGFSYNGHKSNTRSITGVIGIWTDAVSAAISNGGIAKFSNLDAIQYKSVSTFNWWGMSIDLITSPPVYGFTYRGIDYVLGPTFLYEPTGRVTTKSFLQLGPASFTVGLSAAYLASRASRVNTPTRIYVQHYPYTTDDYWWNDYSGKSSSTLRANFNSALKSAGVSAMFSGHAHQSATSFTGIVTDYTTGYAGNAGGPAWFLMVQVSSTRGVLQVKEFNTNGF